MKLNLNPCIQSLVIALKRKYGTFHLFKNKFNLFQDSCHRCRLYMHLRMYTLYLVITGMSKEGVNDLTKPPYEWNGMKAV